MNASAPAPPPAPRAGGLLVPPRGRLHPCFALFCAFLTLDVAVLLLVPYFLTRHGDSPWNDPARLGFLGKAIASGLAFGLVASVSAERRGRSPWWFLAGHGGPVAAGLLALAEVDASRPFAATLAVVGVGFLGAVVALTAAARPLPAPRPLGPALDGVARAAYAVSNIWVGIVLMSVVAIAVQYGSIHENLYGAKSAHANVYRSLWFGATWFVAGLSMLAATFRKWPWRLEQAGWLTVHAGLALVVIGSMMSFFSSVEGEIELREGGASDRVRLRSSSRLVVEEMGRREDGRTFRRPVVDRRTSFDADPKRTEERQEFRVPLGGGDPDMTVTVDRYFAAALPYEEWTDDGPEPRAGIELEYRVGGPDGTPATLRLDEEESNSERLPLEGFAFQVEFARLNRPLYDAILRKEEPKDHGRLVLRDVTGKEVAALAVAPESRPAGADDGAPARLTGAAEPAPGVTATLVQYADQAGRMPGSAEVFDLSPGRPMNPAVVFKLKQGDAEETRVAYAFRPPEQAELERVRSSKFPFVASYAWEPRLPLFGPLLVFTPSDDGMRWIYVSGDGAAVGGVVAFGTPLPLPMPMLTFTPVRAYARANVARGFKFDGYQNDGGRFEVARATVSVAGEAPRILWLRRDGRPETFSAHGRAFAASWSSEERPLGFSLKLNEFLRDFYPGSRSERTFESYLELTHPTKFPTPVDVKIDMNRPLRLDGWRLYQARFGRDDATTFLQVNRDPGLAVIYPACCVVLVGLVVVFFLKRPLRERRLAIEARGASPTRHVLEAAGVVLAVGAGPLLFGLWVAAGLPFGGGAAFLAGLVLIVLVPAGVVVQFARVFGPRRASPRAEGAAS